MLDELKWQIKYGNFITRLLFVNIALFVVLGLIVMFFYLFGSRPENLYSFLAFPSSPEAMIYKPWTIITYQFTHERFFHLFWNMLWLFYIGRISTDFFRHGDDLRLYLFGGVSGAILFAVLYNVFPVFDTQVNASLIGASGSVMALMFATAVYAPNLEINLFGVLRVKLKYLALFYLLVDLITIPNGNAGGHFAHLGGAVFGILFAKFRKNEIRFPAAQLFQDREKPPLRKYKVEVNRNDSKKVNKTHINTYSKSPSQEEIDAILDKISSTGYERLTAEEKEILFKASQD